MSEVKWTAARLKDQMMNNSLMEMMNTKMPNKYSKRIYEFFTVIKEVQEECLDYTNEMVKEFYESVGVKWKMKDKNVIPSEKVTPTPEMQEGFQKVVDVTNEKEFSFEWTPKRIKVKETKGIEREVFEGIFIFPEV